MHTAIYSLKVEVMKKASFAPELGVLEVLC